MRHIAYRKLQEYGEDSHCGVGALLPRPTVLGIDNTWAVCVKLIVEQGIQVCCVYFVVFSLLFWALA